MMHGTTFGKNETRHININTGFTTYAAILIKSHCIRCHTKGMTLND